MKLQTETPTNLNTVTAYGPGWIEINAQRFEGSVLVMPEGEILSWQVDTLDSLTAPDLQGLLQYSPELVLLGTGARQRFPHPRLSAALTAAGVGFDVMDTQAACRTYNILMSEGRRVLAALLAG
jgi:uncharacterized protein